MPDIKCEILETLIVFPEVGGYHKELNLIKWEVIPRSMTFGAGQATARK